MTQAASATDEFPQPPSSADDAPAEVHEINRSPEFLAAEFVRNLTTSQGVSLNRATDQDLYQALGLTVRSLLMPDWLRRIVDQRRGTPKVVAYLSAEYLLGPQLLNSLLTVLAVLGMMFWICGVPGRESIVKVKAPSAMVPGIRRLGMLP